MPQARIILPDRVPKGAQDARIQRMKLACRLLVFASILGVAHRSVAQPPQAITVTSPTLKEGETIPRQYTPDGRNDSPPLAWSGVPAAAKELAVVCEDPDAGIPPAFVHWVVYKIPAAAKIGAAITTSTNLGMCRVPFADIACERAKATKRVFGRVRWSV